MPVWTHINSAASNGPNGSSLPSEGRSIGESLAGNDSPKFKFLFTIKFFPRADVALTEKGSDDMAEMLFSLKTAERPKPTIVYTDANYYNFRTKVASKIDYGQMTVSFYDDRNDRAHDLLQKYLEAVSPVSKLSRGNADMLDKTGQSTSASLSKLNANRHGPFQAIRITHHMLDRVDGDKVIPRKIHYDYLNPKVVNFNPSDFDMSESDVSMIGLTFVYDSVNIVKE